MLFISWFASGLLAGLTWSISLITAESCLEKPYPILLYEPLITFWYNPSISYALKGGFKVAISYITHPRLHISDLES